MQQHPNIASTPEHCINTRTLKQHTNIASRPELCINPKILHKHPTIASTLVVVVVNVFIVIVVSLDGAGLGGHVGGIPYISVVFLVVVFVVAITGKTA